MAIRDSSASQSSHHRVILYLIGVPCTYTRLRPPIAPARCHPRVFPLNRGPGTVDVACVMDRPRQHRSAARPTWRRLQSAINLLRPVTSDYQVVAPRVRNVRQHRYVKVTD